MPKAVATATEMDEERTPVLGRKGESPVPEVEILELDELEEFVPSVAVAAVLPESVAPLSRPKKPSGAKGRRAPKLRAGKEEGPQIKTEEEMMQDEQTRHVPLSPGGGTRKQPPGAFVLPGLATDGEDGAGGVPPRPAGQNVLKVGSVAAFGSGVMPKFDPSKVTLRKANAGSATGAAREAQLLAEKKRAEEAARKEAEAESEWNELAADDQNKREAEQRAEEERRAREEEERAEEARLIAQEEERARQARQKAEAKRREKEEAEKRDPAEPEKKERKKEQAPQ
jgi:hypothetical protein